MSEIIDVKGRMVLDSRGRPTVEADVILSGDVVGRAIVPSGASTGQHEALELRDQGEEFAGQGVDRAIDHVDTQLRQAVRGLDADDQQAVDQVLCACDGTPDKSRLGANALLAVSMAVCAAAARSQRRPLFQHIARLAGREGVRIPRPEIQIFGGGAHAGGRLDIQDLMLIAPSAPSFRATLALTHAVTTAAGRLLQERGQSCGLADEGGYWPPFDSTDEALDTFVESVERAGLRPGEDVAFSLDIAATELVDAQGNYGFRQEGRTLNPVGMIDQVRAWLDRYPIRMLEDPLADEDWASWETLTAQVGERVMLIGDDLFTTSPERIRRGIARRAANAVLVKLNQIGTVSQTLEAVALTRDAGWTPVISARSGETEDSFIAHLAVGTDAGWLKVGALQRGERTAKWNEVLRIAEMLGDRAVFA